jgi:hypothetical protein
MRTINKYTSYGTEDRISIPGRVRTFLFTKTPRPAPGAHPVGTSDALNWQKQLGVKLNTHVLLWRVRIRGDLPTLQHTSSWYDAFNNGQFLNEMIKYVTGQLSA